MKYKIDPMGAKPAYLQLYDQLRDDIVAGLFSYGKKLPSKRLLAEESGVSVVTVEHAYALLTEEGYVESRERSGYFVVFREGELFASVTSVPPPSPPLDTERKGGFPFSVYARAVRKVLADCGEGILSKSAGVGCEELRLALSAYLGRNRGIRATPEQIVIGSGAEYLYGFVVSLLGRERCYAIEDPSYHKIRRVYDLHGACCVPLPMGPDGIDGRALSRCRAHVLHVTPYRSFPSGVTATASKKREYLRWAEQEGRYLVEDDFESEFTLSRKPEETLFSLSGRENVLYINTFSRTVSPSLRVGYMVLPPSLVPVFREKLGFYTCTVPLLEQRVLAELIEGGDFERHVNRVRRRLRQK
ncbi:MAG: PLP-dependent aminotransferase family protein [Clostridia bacterium]|nr:PLP-dependent aminotransferase family protein [Clostridia bacterium]